MVVNRALVYTPFDGGDVIPSVKCARQVGDVLSPVAVFCRSDHAIRLKLLTVINLKAFIFRKCIMQPDNAHNL